jgi:hypothetical protein
MPLPQSVRCVIAPPGENVQPHGVALILALVVLALLSVLAAALLTAVTVELRIGENYETHAQLLYTAEAGIEDGREALRTLLLAPSIDPFIRDKPLLDATGREAGRYSVTLLRTNPMTLRSVGVLRNARRTIETRVRKSGFPALPDAVTLDADIPLPEGMDPRLESTEALEGIVRGIARNATDVFRPGWDEAMPLASVGSPADYRVVVVDGDCEFGNGAGYGILLVRGNLTVHGSFTWNGLVLVIGQGVVGASGKPAGWISGAVFLARTRDTDRSNENPLGTLLGRRGEVTLDLPPESVSIERNELEMIRANERFPYVVTSYREY